MVVKSIAADPNLESEDEDGFPLSISQGKKKEPEEVQPTDSLMIEETKEGKDEGDYANNRKRDSKSVEQDEKPDKESKAEESASAAAVNEDQPIIDREDRPSKNKPSQVRTFPNGLVIEELAMGKPDGKKAEPRKQVSVLYIGKLQKNGKIFDSNIRQAPFKFRLGMRVGDKRRLTIPPSMGHDAKDAGGKIPPNSWLMFDVELVDAR